MANPIILRRGTKEQLDLKLLAWGELAVAEDLATGHKFLAIGDGETTGGDIQMEWDENGSMVIDGGGA